MILSDNALKMHFDSEIRRWFVDKGDQTHRLDYPLDKKSTVIDLGGYEGGWTEGIFNKYNSHIHVFEPVKLYYDGLVEKFAGNEKVQCYHYGLGEAEGEFEIFHSDDGTSMHIDGGDKVSERIAIKKADEFIFSLPGMVDLLKVNIEGAEFDLLPYLVESGAIKKIRNLQVQFHTFVPDCQNRRNRIQQALSQTHELGYNYDFVWENWKLKPEYEPSLWGRIKTSLAAFFTKSET